MLQPGISSIWADLFTHLHPGIHDDLFAASLTHRFAALHATGVPVSEMLAASGADGPLPAEQPAAALWWRLSRHLDPAKHTTLGELLDPDQSRTRRSPQLPEERWKDWANQVNSAWVKSEHWQAVAEQLDRADPAIMDTTRLTQRFRESPATLILAILKDSNDPDQADIHSAGRLQQRTASTTVNKHHLHHRSGSRPTTAPPR